MTKGSTANIHLVGDVNDNMLYKVLRLRTQQLSDVFVTVCGGGGDFCIATSIIDIFEELKKTGIRVTTMAVGDVVSASALLILAGSRRVAYPHAVFGIHEPLVTDVVADPAVARSARVEEHIAVDQFYDILEMYTTTPFVQWKNTLTGRSMLWLTAQQALDHGLVDAVM